MSGFLGLFPNAFAKPGSGGVKTAAQQAEATTRESADWLRQQRATQLGYQNQFGNFLSGTYTPMMTGLADVMKGNAPAAGQYSWMNVSKNPFDTATIGPQVAKANMTTSNQTRADALAKVMASIGRTNSARGLGTTSFGQHFRSEAQLADSLQAARDTAGAQAAGREATLGSFNIDEQLRKEALNNWLTGKSTLQEYMQVLAALGDTSGNAAAMGNVARGWGNVGQGYQTLGNMTYTPQVIDLLKAGIGALATMNKKKVPPVEGEATAWPP